MTQHSKDLHMVCLLVLWGEAKSGSLQGRVLSGHGERVTFHPLLVTPGSKGQCSFMVCFIKHFIPPPPSFPLAWACPVPRGYSSLFLPLREREVATPSLGHQAPRLGERS